MGDIVAAQVCICLINFFYAFSGIDRDVSPVLILVVIRHDALSQDGLNPQLYCLIFLMIILDCSQIAFDLIYLLLQTVADLDTLLVVIPQFLGVADGLFPVFGCSQPAPEPQI